MEMEHSSAERVSTQHRGSTLEANAEHFAKMAARKGIHVADPAGTMKRMYETFIGKRVEPEESQQVPTKDSDPQEEVKDPKTKKKKKKDKKKHGSSTSSSSSSSSSNKKKTKRKKKDKKDKKKKDGKKQKAGKTSGAQKAVREAQKQREAEADAAVDPKFAAILQKFRQNVKPLLPTR